MHDVVEVMKGVDPRSLAICFAAGLTIATAFFLALKVGKLVFKLAILAIALALFGGAYIGLR